ncbi:MAG: 1-deoxy-D-xylulose-5-phosphate reductoisomerase, partial [Polyangiaceae bacterium]
SELRLTASGGPFRDWPLEKIRAATRDEALNHPTWKMGPKITIDSATLMNKGLEVIEASRLFGIDGEHIDVLVHRTSVAHALAIFTDGSVKAQLCPPDMRVPIGYALAYPDRLEDTSLWPDARNVDALQALGGRPDEDATALRFQRPDLQRFPCLRLAYTALQEGGTAPAVLSAANEIAVNAFVDGRIGFRSIADVISATLDAVAHRGEELTLQSVRAADAGARTFATHYLAGARAVAR